MKTIVVKRSLRHKSPVIIMPYYKTTREEEIVEGMIEDFDKDSIVTVNSLEELDMLLRSEKAK